MCANWYQWLNKLIGDKGVNFPCKKKKICIMSVNILLSEGESTNPHSSSVSHILWLLPDWGIVRGWGGDSEMEEGPHNRESQRFGSARGSRSAAVLNHVTGVQLGWNVVNAAFDLCGLSPKKQNKTKRNHFTFRKKSGNLQQRDILQNAYYSSKLSRSSKTRKVWGTVTAERSLSRCDS